ncbi:MAG: hypothetical protein QW303_05065 [Nitrososphaerota archaeon]
MWFKPSKPPTFLKHELINEICGRRGKRVFVITPKKNLDLNIDELYRFLINNGFNINIKANLGITFKNDLKITASILKSGIMIVEGADNEKEAYDFYSKIIIEKLKIPRSNIE